MTDPLCIKATYSFKISVSSGTMKQVETNLTFVLFIIRRNPQKTSLTVSR